MDKQPLGVVLYSYRRQPVPALSSPGLDQRNSLLPLPLLACDSQCLGPQSWAHIQTCAATSEPRAELSETKLLLYMVTQEWESI